MSYTYQQPLRHGTHYINPKERILLVHKQTLKNINQNISSINLVERQVIQNNTSILN